MLAGFWQSCSSAKAGFSRALRGAGAAYIVLLKIALATLLIDHTGELSINSSYWPIYFLPAVTAAEYFGPLGHVALDCVGLGRLLLLSLSRAAGI